jgi:hypothetical protein
MYYLLSSPQGFPLSKCCLNNSRAEPNWRNISRLIAFVANIFPRQEEIQFSDGNRTYFSQPQATAIGIHYFVTFFSGDGESLDLSSISRYVGYVASVLFQPKLEECFKYLEQRTEELIRSSTCNNAIQNYGNDDRDVDDPRSILFGDFPDLMEGLSVFEEHFIPELFHYGLSFCDHWFQPISDFYDNNIASLNIVIPTICSVFTVSNDTLVTLLSSSHCSLRDGGLMEKYLESALVEYAYSSRLHPDDDYSVKRENVRESARTDLLRILASNGCSDGDESPTPGEGSYFAVTAFHQVS